MRKKWAMIAPVPLRLVLGFGLIYHGLPKVFSSAGYNGFVLMLRDIGFPAAGILALGVGLFEFIGGIALIAGAYTSLIASLGFLEMVVAMFAVHISMGFNFINIIGTSPSGPLYGLPGYEVNLLYMAGFLALILGGAGLFSVDDLRGRMDEREMVHPPVHDEPTPVLHDEPTPEQPVPDRAWTGMREPAGTRRG